MTVTNSVSIIPTSKSKYNLFLNYLDQNNTMFKSPSRYDINQTTEDVFNENYWFQMFPNAAYFHVYNSVLGDVFAMIYNNNLQNDKNHTLSSFIIAKHGCSVHPIIDVSPETKYYPAIKNLSETHKSSKVRKALAVSLLKTFADFSVSTTKLLYEQANLSENKFDWDETQAGLLASEMELLDTRPPLDIGSYLYKLGYLTSNLSTSSYIVDVIYTDTQDEELTEKNNALALVLGKQLDTLFDQLTEYSPEPTEKVYKIPPNNDTKLEDNELITSICDELISVQTNYTVLLVQFLQNFIVPLRTQVLENKLLGFTINQINQIFPPTIDEVTRINCIFLDMLKLAQPYGSYEILKACGTTIPYFYKAQIRHEAAIKNFHSNLNDFKTKLNKIGRSDLLSCDHRTIETSIYSSLNLVKIQLIIQRLVKNKEWPTNLKKDVKIFAESCDNTISSFAKDKLKPYNGRVFTPTGKIITELAKGWPTELQFGWLTRRVVAVFDVTDLLVRGVKNRAVIIIFSDHVLFLSIDDDAYYADYWDDGNIHKPSIADTLIHSLTNETPLNKIPNMTVQAWSNINDLYAFHYTTSADTPKSFVRFFDDKKSKFTGVYQLDKISGKYMTEVIARSKILNKSQSFHLFCGSVEEERDKKKVYYTAHESKVYHAEETKSPFIVLFNQEYDEALLDKYNVYSFITLNFVNESIVRLEGLSRCQFDDVADNGKFVYDVNMDVLSDTLSLIFTELFTTHMSLYNPVMMKYLLTNNAHVNKHAYEVLRLTVENLNSDQIRIVEHIQKMKKEREIINNVSNKDINRKKSLELLEAKENKTKTIQVKNIVESKKEKKVVKKKKSFFDFFKSKKQAAVGKSQPQRKSSVIYQRISSIKRNKEIPYESLKPAKPKQRKAEKRPSHAFANISQSKNHIVDKPLQVSEPETSVDETFSDKEIKKDAETTASTAIYVNSHFEFPMEPASSNSGIDESSAPKYAQLKGESDHMKGYKDSVDLMGAFQSSLKKTELPKESYDDDLFELNHEKKKTDPIKVAKMGGDILVLPVAKICDTESPYATHILPPSDTLDLLNPFLEVTPKKDCELEQPNSSAKANVWRELTKPIASTLAATQIDVTPPSTPKMIGSPVFTKKEPITPNTPKNQAIASSRVIKSPNVDGKINYIKKSPAKANLDKPVPLIAQLPQTEPASPYRDQSMGLQQQNKSVFASKPLPIIHKSGSFYQRFKQLRDEQDNKLRQYGICRVPDLTKLLLHDQNIIKSGFVLVDDIAEIPEVEYEPIAEGSEDLKMNAGKLNQVADDNSHRFKIKIIDSKVVHRSPQRHISNTSSVYATTEDELNDTSNDNHFMRSPIIEDEEIEYAAEEDEHEEQEEDILGLNLDMKDMSMISFSQLTLTSDDDLLNERKFHARKGALNEDSLLVRDESYRYLGDILNPKMKRDQTEYDIVLKRRLADSKSVGWIGKYLGD